MTADVLALAAPTGVGFDGLEDALAETFGKIVAALTDGRAVVMHVWERDLHGHGDVADATAAHATLGIVRALAIEGGRNGWRINALGIEDDVDPDVFAWTEWLGEASGVSGALIHLGDHHLGRVPT